MHNSVVNAVKQRQIRTGEGNIWRIWSISLSCRELCNRIITWTAAEEGGNTANNIDLKEKDSGKASFHECDLIFWSFRHNPAGERTLNTIYRHYLWCILWNKYKYWTCMSNISSNYNEKYLFTLGKLSRTYAEHSNNKKD